MKEIEIKLNPSKFIKVLSVIALILILGNLFSIISRFVFHHSYVFGLVPIFDLDNERGIGNLFSSVLLLVCATLLLLISYTKKKGSNKKDWHWTGLSLIFYFLVLDEFVSIHERLTDPIRNLLNTSGILYFAWVIPYSIIVVILLLIYIPFVFRLPRKFGMLFLLSGLIYLTGAIGFELIGSYYFGLHGEKKLILYIIASVEETFEMMGAIFFIYSLLSYIKFTEVRYHLI
jgi:hypothetical protein